jgi:hypothetical protein
MVAAYAAPPAALDFSAYGAAAGKYVAQATAADITKSSGSITVPAEGTVSANFAFP